jgi:DNA helicase II / ATP-dependent DNA helicase PcrA
MLFAPNPKQKTAIEHERGPMLVVAGAGTGKTTVLVERVARLVGNKIATHEEILCVTYMRNAARELKERIALRTGSSPENIQAYTIHGYCEGVLKRASQKLQHIEKEDLWIYLRQNIHELKLHHFSKASNPGEFLRDLLDMFDRCNDELRTSTDYAAYVERVRKGDCPLPRVGKFKKGYEPTREEVLARCDEIARVFTTVEAILRDKGWMLYGQMIPATINVLRADPEKLAQERACARFILIDEFQDCNRGQIELMALLAGEDRNIFSVGDPDQGIFRFRGATSAAFEDFLEIYPDARGVVLDENLRSRSPILRTAFALIEENPGIQVAAKTGDSFARALPISVRDPQSKAEALPVLALVGKGFDGEASEVATRIEELRKRRASHPGKPRFGVLYRNHWHRKELIPELAERGIPFVVRGLNALETAEVRDISAVLRVMLNPHDSTSLFRACALPMFAIDPVPVQRSLRSSGGKVPLSELLKGQPPAANVLAMLDKARQAAASVGWNALRSAGAATKIFAFDEKHEALAAFLRFLKEWEKKPTTSSGQLGEFLAYMEWMSDAGKTINVDSEDDPESPPEVVRLMTAHAAKGLEFDHVFILRANSPSFPSSYKQALFEFPKELRANPDLQPDSKVAQSEEERRLFYVAMTRARDTLAICAKPGAGKKDLSPVGFLRPLLASSKLKGVLQQVAFQPFTIPMLTARAELNPTSGVGAWLLRPPSATLVDGPLSAGAIERYDNCPLQFKLQREWKIPGSVSANLLYGNVAHQVLKDYFDAVIAGKPRTAEQSVALFMEMMTAAPFDDAHQRDLYIAKGKGEIAEFVAAQTAAAFPKVLHTEKSFDIKVNDIRVTGRVDRIDDLGDNTVRIVDYKSGTPKDQEKAKRSIQLSIYALAAKEAWGYDAQKLVLYNLEDQSEAEATRDAAELDAARERVRKVAESIAAGDFHAKPGQNCSYCDYRELCPATEERLYSITLAQAAATKN